MKGMRRSVYFTNSELDLFEFIQSKNGNFNYALKEIIRQAKQKEDYQATELTDLMQELISEMVEIKNEIQSIKQLPIQAVLPSSNESDIGIKKEVMQVDERDYSGFDDL